LNGPKLQKVYLKMSCVTYYILSPPVSNTAHFKINVL